MVRIIERLAVDLLVVVDRTPSMADQDDRLRATLRQFAYVLSTIDGGPVDLHVGIVTTDLGAAGVPGCSARGDAGAFVDPRSCGVDGWFLRDDGDGARNHPGDLAEAMACLGAMPLSSCPVSQPLAAIVASLDGSSPRNDGFRRSHARLAVIIISDGDDCSLIDTDALAGITGESAVDYACHTLDPAALADVDATLLHLRSSAVDHPAKLILGTVTGSPEVRIGPGPSLEPVCDTDGLVGPAPRLHGAELPERTTNVNMCNENWVEVLTQVAETRWVIPGNTCFSGDIDLAPDVPGLQADCTGMLLHTVDGALVPFAVVPWCGAPEHTLGQPCLRPGADELRCPDSIISITLDHAPHSLPADATAVDIRCALSCESS